jgi:hypothetical protein
MSGGSSGWNFKGSGPEASGSRERLPPIGGLAMLRKRTLTAERQKSADVANDIDQSLPFSKRLLRRGK